MIVSTWQHAFDWAFEHGVPGTAFDYAEWYAAEYPEGDASHTLAYGLYWKVYAHDAPASER